MSLRARALKPERSNLIAMQERSYYVYIMSNKRNNVLYTGITNDLERRVYEHKQKIFKGFTGKYNLDKLVYYEAYETAEEAILREKQIKGGSRKKKLDLIRKENIKFEDLAADWF